jgi:hypothetical protein
MNEHRLPDSRNQPELSASWKAWLSSDDFQKLRVQQKNNHRETAFDSLPVYDDE